MGDAEAIACTPKFLPRASLDLCAGVIVGPPPATADIPARETLITAKWLHHELHDSMPSLPVHVIATYYGAPIARTWQCGRIHLAGIGSPGKIAIVPAGWGGRWDINGSGHLSYVFLSDIRLQEVAQDCLPGGRRIELPPSLAKDDGVGSQILRVLSRCAARPDPSASLFIEQTLDLLCLHFMRNHSSASDHNVLAPKGGLAPWQERRAREMLLSNIDGRISLEKLAATCGLSRSHFARAFKLTTGSAPFQWLQRQRIERAKNLLLNSRLAGEEIAQQCGFTDQSHLTRVFSRCVGMTPGVWRRTNSF